MTTERTERAKSFLAGVLPDKMLESLPDARSGLESVENAFGGGDPLGAAAARATEKIKTGQDLAPIEQFALEAIIIPDKRPAIDIVGGDFMAVHPLWLKLNEEPVKTALRKTFPSIGRIELPGHPTLPYGGTGFVVGRDLLMTNRHVAEIFSAGLGTSHLIFRQGLKAGIDFLRERDSSPVEQMVEVRSVAMIHPYWDMALLRVEGLEAHAPLTLCLTQPEDLAGREIAVVGYPAFDPRNAADVQNQVFGGVYYIKRLQPGVVNGRDTVDSFGKTVSAATHDSSTLGGNSGSAVIDIHTGQVVGLHFAGLYLKSNYAVPTAELARDARVVDMGLTFEKAVKPEAGLWGEWWRATEAADPESRPAPRVDPAPTSPPAPRPAEVAHWTVPIEISIRVGDSAPVQGGGSASICGADAPDAGPADAEAMVEPAHDEDYDNRQGYDAKFLGVEAPLPHVLNERVLAHLSDGTSVLTYRHFSIVMHAKRRLALFTASNLDQSAAARAPKAGRSTTRKALSGLGDHDMEKWFTDPRIPALDQLPDRFFTKDRGAFDKGHIVRREDVTWGETLDEVRDANGDTFHVTNCSPQVAGFNRPKQVENWGDLERYVSQQGAGDRLSLLAGPVLADDDPIFVGVDDRGPARIQIPKRFWKVVLAAERGRLQAFAFMLEQDLDDTPLEFVVENQWRPSLIAIPDLERTLRLLRFPPEIHAADQAGTAAGDEVRRRSGAKPRQSPRTPPGGRENGAQESLSPAPVLAPKRRPTPELGPLTFRDHFLSLYQSAAAEVASGGAGAEEGVAPAPGGANETSAQILRAADAVAQARADGLRGPITAQPFDAPALESMPVSDRGTLCASLAMQLLEAKVFGDGDTAARLEGELIAGTCDPRWVRTIGEYSRYFGPRGTRREPQYTTPAQAGEGVISVKPGARIALVGDWGTGAAPARRILRHIRDQQPDILIHLGDIYYSGTESECRAKFEVLMEEVFGPVSTRIPVFTLSGNHDMYCGGVGYYGLIGRLNTGAFRQPASFFCLRAEDGSWQVLAMDTGRHDYSPLSVTDALTFVEAEEQAWLRRRIDDFGGRTILLSHHQLFSAYSQIGKADRLGRTQACNPKLLALFTSLTSGGKSIPAWFWGHEHNLCVYESFAGLERGRCLGHGAIPVFASDDPYQPLATLDQLPRIVEGTRLSTAGDVFTHGFAVVTLSAGGNADAAYFEDLNGSARVLYREQV